MPIGSRWHRLTILRYSHSTRSGEYYLVACICGAVKTVRGTCIRQGVIRSCGCYSRENSRTRIAVAIAASAIQRRFATELKRRQHEAWPRRAAPSVPPLPTRHAEACCRTSRWTHSELRCGACKQQTAKPPGLCARKQMEHAAVV